MRRLTLNQLQGSGLLAFSDPAGAKACLGLAALLKVRNPHKPLVLYSNKTYDFYSHWPFPVVVTEKVTADKLPFRPDWVFTGTSHPDSSKCFELHVLKQASKMHIPTYSLVDHWTNIRLRFTWAEGSLQLPDTVAVLDTKAYESAVLEGLPQSHLALTNNPYLDYIAQRWQPTETAEQILQKAGAPSEITRYVLYAPDPISLRNDAGVWKFDELSALSDLAKALKQLKSPVALLVKAHPLQPMQPLVDHIASLKVQLFREIRIAPFVDNLDLAAAAMVVVGFYSNFLLEAIALNKPVIRYFPESTHLDALAHLNPGLKAATLTQLTDALAEILEV